MQIKRLLIGFVIATGLMLSLQTISFAIPEEGLVFYLAFNEGQGNVAKDASPNAFEASLEGDYKWVPGKAGSAIEFNQGAAIVPDDDRLDIPQITVSAWIFPKSITEDPFADQWWTFNNIIYDKSGSSDDSVALGLIAGGGAYFYIDNGGDNVLKMPDLAIQTGQWYHIAATFDGTNMEVYLNGEMVGEKLVAGAIIQNDNNCEIGGRLDQTIWFSGIIDEVAVFERALDENEINETMSSLIAVEQKSKLATTWASLKAES